MISLFDVELMFLFLFKKKPRNIYTKHKQINKRIIPFDNINKTIIIEYNNKISGLMMKTELKLVGCLAPEYRPGWIMLWVEKSKIREQIHFKKLPEKTTKPGNW